MKRLEHVENKRYWDNQSVTNWTVNSPEDFTEINETLNKLELSTDSYNIYIETNSDSLAYEKHSYEITSCVAIEFIGEKIDKKQMNTDLTNMYIRMLNYTEKQLAGFY